MSDPTHRLTPRWILDRVRALGPIGLDPCTFADNPVGASAFFTAEDDGLSREWWQLYGLVFVNEPYSRIDSPAWSMKIADQARKGAEIVRLTKAATGTTWFHNSVWNAAQAVCFLKGRPKHDAPGAEASGPGKFDSCLPYYGPRACAFARAFEGAGRVVFL
jgi:phage N-6-adenine-methyltransferase